MNTIQAIVNRVTRRADSPPRAPEHSGQSQLDAAQGKIEELARRAESAKPA